MVSVFGWRSAEETNARGDSTENPWEPPAATLHLGWEPVRSSMAATGQPVITRLDPPNALSAPYVPQQNWNSHHRPVTLAERPKLWDVQIQLPGTDIHKKQPSLCWDEIMVGK